MRRTLPGVADAAVHLDRRLTDGVRGFRAVHLRDAGGFGRDAGLLLVDRPRGIAQDAIVMNLDDLLCAGTYED